MGSTALFWVVATASVGLNPVDVVACDKVDLVEVNHFYDEQGRLVFDQIIYYDWAPDRGRYNVRAWRLLKKPAQVPRRDWQRDGYVAIWHDSGVLRKVEAKSVRETWTQYDPELVEREFLPKEKRRELTRLSIKKTTRR